MYVTTNYTHEVIDMSKYYEDQLYTCPDPLAFLCDQDFNKPSTVCVENALIEKVANVDRCVCIVGTEAKDGACLPIKYFSIDRSYEEPLVTHSNDYQATFDYDYKDKKWWGYFISGNGLKRRSWSGTITDPINFADLSAGDIKYLGCNHYSQKCIGSKNRIYFMNLIERSVLEIPHSYIDDDHFYTKVIMTRNKQFGIVPLNSQPEASQ
jgi:hypothetical protein